MKKFNRYCLFSFQLTPLVPLPSQLGLRNWRLLYYCVFHNYFRSSYCLNIRGAVTISPLFRFVFFLGWSSHPNWCSSAVITSGDRDGFCREQAFLRICLPQSQRQGHLWLWRELYSLEQLASTATHTLRDRGIKCMIDRKIEEDCPPTFERRELSSGCLRVSGCLRLQKCGWRKEQEREGVRPL